MGPPLSFARWNQDACNILFWTNTNYLFISRTRIATTTTAHDNLTTHTKHINPTTFHRPVIAYVPDNIPVLLDNKRGDIGSTAVAYAESAYQQYKADAVTVNPYMGTDSVAPFTNDPTKGKNDGSVKGERYFTTTKGRGLMVKLRDVTKVIR